MEDYREYEILQVEYPELYFEYYYETEIEYLLDD